MSRVWRWLKFLILAGLAFTVLYVVFALMYLDFIVDLWWFGSLGYEAYFWLRLSYRYLIFGGFASACFLIFFLNFWAASRFLGASPAAGLGNAAALSRTKALIHKFRSGSLKVYTP